MQALAFLGFGVAVIWIESMANEIVNLLQVREDEQGWVGIARVHPHLLISSKLLN